MDIRQIKSTNDDSRVVLLNSLYATSGNCMMNGFIGDSIKSYSFDENGNLEFVSSRKDARSQIDSTGAVLNNGVVIKQVQKSENGNYNHLFSWNVGKSLYTYILFDDEKSMNNCYNEIKKRDINLCDGDVTSILGNIGVSFDNISQILLNQKVDSASSLIDAAEEEFVDKTAFTL